MDPDPVTKEFAVFDCDAHVNDPLAIWDRYVPSTKRDLVRRTYWRSDNEAWLNGTTRARGGGNGEFAPSYNPICIAGPQMNKTIMRKLMSMAPLTAEQRAYLHHDGAVDAHARIREMNLMGIDQVLVIPTSFIQNLPFAEDADAVTVLCQAYNNWCRDWCGEVPDRLFGAALLPLNRPEDAAAEIERTADLGFRVALMRPVDARGAYPNDLGLTASGPTPRRLTSLDSVFRTFEETGMVLGMHTFPAMRPGRTAGPGLLFSPGELLTYAETDSQTLSFVFEMQAWLAQVLLSGFLDRYPRLKMAAFESNSQWLPQFLQSCDRLFKLYTRERAVPASRLPSEAFAEQCVISFESDELPTMRQWRSFASLGIWASDCYHHDGADAWSAIRAMRAVGVPESVQADLMGGNARRMYGIDGSCFVTEESGPIERPDWFPQGLEFERWAQLVADPRRHASELAETGIGRQIGLSVSANDLADRSGARY